MVGVIRVLADRDFTSPEFRRLLWLAVEQPRAELDRIVREDLPSLVVRGVTEGGLLAGFVAFAVMPEMVTIEYIAVVDERQGAGIGTALLAVVLDAAQGKAVYAQTDDDAVGFYRSRGFAIAFGAADDRWPDRVRYDCTLPGPPSASNKIIIRPAVVEDAAAIGEVHLASSEEAYAGLLPVEFFRSRRTQAQDWVDRWRQIIEGGRHDVYVASDADTQAVGFICVGNGRDEPGIGLPALEVQTLYVRASVYGTGTGYALLTTALGSSDAYLWVLQGNERAITFYERQGFRFDGASRTEVVGLERRMVRA